MIRPDARNPAASRSLRAVSRAIRASRQDTSRLQRIEEDCELDRGGFGEYRQVRRKGGEQRRFHSEVRWRRNDLGGGEGSRIVRKIGGRKCRGRNQRGVRQTQAILEAASEEVISREGVDAQERETLCLEEEPHP